jgi:hypothetical protein
MIRFAHPRSLAALASFLVVVSVLAACSAEVEIQGVATGDRTPTPPGETGEEPHS